MDAGGIVWNIAVSRDGKWIVSGTESGQVTVWNTESHKKVTEFKAHNNLMRALDVSPDGTRIATGSDDKTVCVWSLQTGRRFLGPLQHSFSVAAVRFSPNGYYIAAATWFRNSVRTYHSETGSLCSNFPIRVTLSENQSLAWASDSRQLFASSYYGKIHCPTVTDWNTFSEAQWPIDSSSNLTCIALASNETFIAVSAESSVSFWDTTSHKQIGSVIKHTAYVESITISANYHIVVGGGKAITVWSLCDILPLPYSDHVSATAHVRRLPNPNLFPDCCRISPSGPQGACRRTRLVSRRLLNYLSLIVMIFVHRSRAYMRSWVRIEKHTNIFNLVLIRVS